MPGDDERLLAAREYLADWLRDEEMFGEDSLPWFVALAEHVGRLPSSDPRIVLAALCLGPFLDDDERVDCTMYPNGSAVQYVEDVGWGGDHDEYLAGFVDALSHDWQTWQFMIAQDGEAATWRMDDQDDREGPTLPELAELAATLPHDRTQALLMAVQPRSAVRAAPSTPAPPPTYSSWDDYLTNTSLKDRARWCRVKASKANRTRLMSDPPDVRVTWRDVLAVLEGARGRCAHCNSLAVENRPSKASGAPLPWEHVGRRIGSLGHRRARFSGGSNALDNLCWSCLWCNTWPEERRPGATDHGGHFPQPEADVNRHEQPTGTPVV